MPRIAVNRGQPCTVCGEPLRKPDEDCVIKQIKKCGHLFHENCLADQLRRPVGERAPVQHAECPHEGCEERVYFAYKRGGDLTYNEDGKSPAIMNRVITVQLDEQQGLQRSASLVKRSAFILTAIAVASFSAAFLTTFTGFAVAAVVLAAALFFENRAIHSYLQVEGDIFRVVPRAHA